jgi:hypothetical protein
MSESVEIVTRQNAERDRPTHRRCEEVAASQMTGAVRSLDYAVALVRATGRQAWLAEIEEIAANAKRVRDAMYAEQGPIELHGHRSTEG